MSQMTPRQIQEAMKARLLRDASYFEGLATSYQESLKGHPTYMHKQKIAKIRTLAILSREIAYELTR